MYIQEDFLLECLCLTVLKSVSELQKPGSMPNSNFQTFPNKNPPNNVSIQNQHDFYGMVLLCCLYQICYFMHSVSDKDDMYVHQKQCLITLVFTMNASNDFKILFRGFTRHFLAVQNSSIGDLVPCFVCPALLTIRAFTTLQSDRRNL